MFGDISPWAVVTQCQVSHFCRKSHEIIIYYTHQYYPIKSSAFTIIIPRFDYFTLWLSFISLFMIIFTIILAKKRDMKLKYRQKFSYFGILWNLFVANLDFFWLNRFLVPTPNTMSGIPCDDISRGKFWIWKTSAFQIH